MDDCHNRLAEREDEMPLALILADNLEKQVLIGEAKYYLDGDAADELRRLHTQHQADQERIKELETLNKALVNTAKGFLEAIETERNTTKTPAEINWMVVNHWAYMFAHLVKKDKAEGEHQQSRRE